MESEPRPAFDTIHPPNQTLEVDLTPKELSELSFNLRRPFSPREAEALDNISRGFSNTQTAMNMGVSYGTVKNYNGIILFKTQAATMPQAVDRGFEVEALMPDVIEEGVEQPELTDVEHAEIILIAGGLTIIRSAHQQGLNMGTINKRRARIREKFDATNTSQVIRKAWEFGIPTRTT
ncbi:MAG TPA: LuxR C-terminal-related transcriptional regulator [Candidatus Saccharimonadales bacterium]|nr:LuxR C-terminal-related transcriptional regulator [Candidatus Saccharimonadales bacterium]